MNYEHQELGFSVGHWQPHKRPTLCAALLDRPDPILGGLQGGWWILLPPLSVIGTFALLDALLGETDESVDPATDESKLFWHRAIVVGWVPVAILMTLWMLWYVPQAEHLSGLEKVFVFFGVGLLNGATGIVFAHELMHQKNQTERWAGDILMGLVAYGHFRTEAFVGASSLCWHASGRCLGALQREFSCFFLACYRARVQQCVAR